MYKKASEQTLTQAVNCICFVCGSTTHSPAFAGRLINGHHLFRCSNCGMIVAKTEQIEESIHSDYGDYLIRADSWKIHLANTKKAHFDKLEKLSAKKKKTILDFGAGAGFFVKLAQDMGFEAVGYEPSEKLRVFASQVLNVTLFNNLRDIVGTFDVICMFDVIEHIPSEDQREVMDFLINRLNPGGLFIGNTPNIRSANILLRQENDPVVWPPYHCSYFSLYSLDKYLSSFGLVKISQYTKGFRGFRANKECASFLEKSTTSVLLKWSFIYPIKVVLRMLSYVLSPAGLGYQIYFEYRMNGE